MSDKALKKRFDELSARAHKLRLEALLISKEANRLEEMARMTLREMTGMNTVPSKPGNRRKTDE